MASRSLRSLLNKELNFLDSVQSKNKLKVLFGLRISEFETRYKNDSVELEVNRLLEEINDTLTLLDNDYNQDDFKFISSDTSIFYPKMNIPIMRKYFKFLLHSTVEAEKSVLLRIRQ